MRFVLCLVCFPALLCAQSVALVRSGITFDSDSKTFRPVLGVPGAAVLGEALEVRGELRNVSPCSQQQFTLAAVGRGGVVTLLHLDTLKSSEISPALTGSPTALALSAGCSAAVVYSAPTNRLQIVTGLPSKPVVAADLIVDLPEAVSSLAVSDDGQHVVAAVPGKAVYLVPAAGRPVALLPIQQDAVVAMRGNQDAIVGDRSANTVTLIANIAGSPAVTALAGSSEGVDNPGAVWFDSRTAAVLVANAGSGKINLIPLSGGSATVVDCHCRLSGLSPLTDRTYQLQSAEAGQPLRILDLGTSSPRVVFVATPERPDFHKGRNTAISDNSKN